MNDTWTAKVTHHQQGQLVGLLSRPRGDPGRCGPGLPSPPHCVPAEQGSCLTPLSLDFLACEQSWSPRRLAGLDEVAQGRWAPAALPGPTRLLLGFLGGGWSRCPLSWLAWKVILELKRARRLRTKAWPDPVQPQAARDPGGVCSLCGSCPHTHCSPTVWHFAGP